MNRSCRLFDTAIGRCGLAWGPQGIVAVQLPQPSEAQTRTRLQQRVGPLEETEPPPAVATLGYGDIARRLGGVALSREVGQALGQNPCPIVVPCHRVAAGGKPGGFSASGGTATKLKMLAIEGAYVNHTPSRFDHVAAQPSGNT